MISHLYIQRTHIARAVLLGLLTPFFAFAHDHGTAAQCNLSPAQKAAALLLAEKAKKAKRVLASELLRSKPNTFATVWEKQSIVSSFEKRELQINDLITKCSRSVTAFGDTGLGQLMIPVADKSEIFRRQDIVRSLVKDEALFANLRKALESLAKGEDALLAYWDPNNAIHREAKSYYYSMLPNLSSSFDMVNFNKLALDAGYWSSLGAYSTLLLSYMCVDGFRELTTDKAKRAELFAKLGRWDLVGFFKGFVLGKSWDTFKRPFVYDNVLNKEDGDAQLFPIDKDTQSAVFDPIAWAILMSSGSMGDRYDAMYEPITGVGRALGGDTGSSLAKPIGWASGVAAAGAGAGMNVAIWAGLLKISYEGLQHHVVAIKDLRKSLVSVAQCTRALQDLERFVAQSPTLRDTKALSYLSQVMNKNNWSVKYKQLMSLLTSPTFNSTDSKVFRVGNVLLAHKLMQEVKDELVPALQAAAEFDAYCSLAQLCKEHADKDNGFAFVEFIEHDTPQIKIDACWEPLVSDRQAVVNDIRLGVDNKGIRMMITGPNGCGKSTFLKSLGHAVIMAQSWGIVPGKKAQMTLFSGLRTSLDPKEDILNGISTFMAQRMRISEVQDFARTTRMTQKVLVMLDEPFRGTTDYLTEECIYDFGKEMEQLDNVVVCIATHVKKPVELARKGSFANYHVEIETLRNGDFKRLFTIAPGAADKWLNDRQWMKDFVYWLDRDMQKNAARK